MLFVYLSSTCNRKLHFSQQQSSNQNIKLQHIFILQTQHFNILAPYPVLCKVSWKPSNAMAFGHHSCSPNANELNKPLFKKCKWVALNDNKNCAPFGHFNQVNLQRVNGNRHSWRPKVNLINTYFQHNFASMLCFDLPEHYCCQSTTSSDQSSLTLGHTRREEQLSAVNNLYCCTDGIPLVGKILSNQTFTSN